MKDYSLYSDQIDKALKNVKGFTAALPRDMTPHKKIHRLESGVFNLGASDTGGTHWVCYYNDPKHDVVEWFDSFGSPPPEEPLAYLRTSGKPIAYNDWQLQAFNASVCGYFCIYYIRERAKGRSQYDIIYSFNPNNLRQNDERVLKEVKI